MKTSALERFLRYVTSTRGRTNTRRRFRARRGSWCCCARSSTELRSARPGRRGDGRARLRDGDDPGDHGCERRAGRSASSRMSTRRRRCPATTSGRSCTRGYDGRDLVLPDDPAAVLRASDNPALAAQIGHDIVTASGLTLLGADDKAGVAEIVAAAEHLMTHPEIPHGRCALRSRPTRRSAAARITSTSQRFGAVCAYTLDGGSRGELSSRASPPTRSPSRSKASTRIRATRRGAWSTRSGWRRISSPVCRATEMSPETTDGYEGYLHPYQVQASVDRTTRQGAGARLRDGGG